MKGNTICPLSSVTVPLWTNNKSILGQSFQFAFCFFLFNFKKEGFETKELDV